MRKKFFLLVLLTSFFILAATQSVLAADYFYGASPVTVHTSGTGHYVSSNLGADANGFSTLEKFTSITVKGYLGSGATWGIGYYLYDSSGNVTGTYLQSMGSADPNTTITPAVDSPNLFLYVDNAGYDTYIYVSDCSEDNMQGNLDTAHWQTPSDFSAPSGGGGSGGVTVISDTSGNVTINFPAPPTPPPVVAPPATPAAPTLSPPPINYTQPDPYQQEASNPVTIPVPSYTQPPDIASPGPLPTAPDLNSTLPAHDTPTTADQPTARDQATTADQPTAPDQATTADQPTAPDQATTADQPTAPDPVQSPDTNQRDPVLTPDPALTPDPIPN